MKYVDILRTVNGTERYYVGITGDLRARLQKHDSGEVPHTSKFVPWEIKTYIAFSDASQAVAFEKHLNRHLVEPLQRSAFERRDWT